MLGRGARGSQPRSQRVEKPQGVRVVANIDALGLVSAIKGNLDISVALVNGAYMAEIDFFRCCRRSERARLQGERTAGENRKECIGHVDT